MVVNILVISQISIHGDNIFNFVREPWVVSVVVVDLYIFIPFNTLLPGLSIFFKCTSTSQAVLFIKIWTIVIHILYNTL